MTGGIGNAENVSMTSPCFLFQDCVTSAQDVFMFLVPAIGVLSAIAMLQVTITVTSYRRHGVSVTDNLTGCSTACSGLHHRKQQSCAFLPICEGDRPITSRFPSQRANNAECSHNVIMAFLGTYLLSFVHATLLAV